VAVKVVLDTPIIGPTTPDLEICHLELHRGVKFVGAVRILDKALSYININVVGQNGVSLPFAYTGATADDLCVALDKANLAIKDLHTRVFERLIADGLLKGTISGSPD
jgi:hypothetical protein